MSHSLLAAIVLASLGFMSCGSSKTQLPAATGATQNLAARQGTTLFWVDEIGPVSSPYNAGTARVPANGELTARGWAADKESQAPAGGVDIVIDNVPYAAKYGIDRADVAEGQKVPAYVKTGWQFSMPAAQFRGSHSLALRILTADGKSYYQTPPLTLIVE